jgi:hypothetical protein
MRSMRLEAGLIRYERQKLDRMQTLMSNHADLFDHRQLRAYKRRIQRQRELCERLEAIEEDGGKGNEKRL